MYVTDKKCFLLVCTPFSNSCFLIWKIIYKSEIGVKTVHGWHWIPQSWYCNSFSTPYHRHVPNKNTRNTKTKIGSILYLHAKFNLLPTASVQQHHRWMSSIQYTRSVYPWLQMMQCTRTEQQQHPNQSWKMPSHCLPGTSSLQAKVYGLVSAAPSFDLQTTVKCS